MTKREETPLWIEAVTPTEILRQRTLGWPDFHPEDFCHRCGRRNPVWWVQSEHWNQAVDGSERGVVDILCPCCFAITWELATGLRVIWELRLDPMSKSLKETPSASSTYINTREKLDEQQTT